MFDWSCLYDDQHVCHTEGHCGMWAAESPRGVKLLWFTPLFISVLCSECEYYCVWGGGLFIQLFFFFGHASTSCLSIQRTALLHFSSQQFGTSDSVYQDQLALDQTVYLLRNSRSHWVKLLIIACTLKRQIQVVRWRMNLSRDLSCL